MKTTANYGLKKPDGTDLVDIENFNYNADIIDTELAKRALKTDIPSIPVTSVNGKTGAVTVSKSDVGLGSVNNWGATTAINSTSTTTYATASAVKQAYDKGNEALTKANSAATNLLTKQDVSDNTLTTTAKTIVGAINELDSTISKLSSSPSSVIKSVQRGTFSTKSVALTVQITTVNISKSILLMNVRNRGGDGYDVGGTGTLKASSIVFALPSVFTYGSDTVVDWQVIEFN